ncbi:MAG TPA: hypothetical protein VFM50_10500 [Nocardioidaceae bacterium]|nr:hypothetical protein [Nocardioidaceae bacterium]
MLPRLGVPLQSPLPAPVHRPAAGEQQRTEDEETDVPGQRRSQIVADVVDAEELVVLTSSPATVVTG